MAEVDARVAFVTQQPSRARADATTSVAVEVAAGARLAEIQMEWRDLIVRADVANIFMHPVLIALSACYPDSRSRALLVWQNSPGRRRLAGFWAFNAGRAPRSIIPLSALAAPPFAQAYLASPVIDRDLLDETLQAMLDHIAADPSLPNVVALDAMRDDGATTQALMRVLAARGSAPAILRRFRRPMLASKLDAKQYMESALSASRRKKLRQHRRRLAEKGTLESTIISEPEAVGRALEDFLRLEAAGWKGRKRTALLSNPPDATFAREMVTALAPLGEAWIHALTLDGRTVSMQIVLRAGTTAFTWKTTYDETLHDFSPGMLLFEDYTAALLADPGITCVDSCSYDDSSFMASWSERQPMAEMWIDARRGGSATFAHLSRLQAVYLRLRAQAKAAYRAGARRETA
ncbi:MAG TPA: GNAT family N-acetyltransferase [Pseudolabrys sp.]|nr:GNAT family N-acetyltransferase [Pseudolabrys sp.]